MKKPFVVVIISVLFLGILACALSVVYAGKEGVAPEALLLHQANFPSTWQTNATTIQVNWQIAETFIDQTPETEWDARQSASRFWTEDGHKPVSAYLQISQRVFRYANSFQAIWWFHANYPERIYNQQWPNFTFPEERKNRYPVSWQGNASANQEHIVCAMGGSESCQLWFYRARYGSYIEEIKFFGPNMGISEKLFALIVQEMNASLISILETNP